MKKKVLIFLLTLCMIITSLPISVLAQEKTIDEEFASSVSNSTPVEVNIENTKGSTVEDESNQNKETTNTVENNSENNQNNQTELLLLVRSKESPFEEESLCALINQICIQYSPC